MSRMTNKAVASQLTRIFGGESVAGLPESQLLQRFVERRDEVAFEAIVTRHGPMVMGVCRRILRDPNDIDDAFQATFLILVKKAGSLRDRNRLANWLYGVAYRVAIRAKADGSRKRGLDLESSPEPIALESTATPEMDEVLGSLDHELRRLSEKYRAPLILCHLEGQTHEQAAERLNWPVGTVRGRLSRGRELLKGRLIRRGMAPVLAAIAVPSTTSVRANLADSLIRSTVKSGMAVIQGKGTMAGMVSASAFALSRHSMETSTMTKLALALAGLMSLGLLGGIAIQAKQAANEPPANNTAPPTEPEAKPKPRETARTSALEPPHAVRPGDRLRIEVLEALPGRPITGERIVRPDGTISLEFYGDLQVNGLNRYEIKVKVVEHLRKYLTAEVLGLVETAEDGKPIAVSAADSDRVYVEEGPFAKTETELTLKSLERELVNVSAQLSTVMHLLKEQQAKEAKQKNTGPTDEPSTEQEAPPAKP